MPNVDYEKLGVFYLGREYDLAKRARGEGLVLYDSKDLVTHAVCVGMTGSGKTGLCLGLLEEAAIDGIPAIIIDPKGDLSNLLLTFPDLRGADFRPWINEDDARQKGTPPDQYAQQQADLWKKGLAEWRQEPERIARLKSSAEFVVYTPGSAAGLPVSVLRTFSAPPEALREDVEMFRERIAGTATSLLGLLGIAADPVQSREHILLSAIFGAAWGSGQDLDLPGLIHQIQQPPFVKLGVMELESVYPAKERFALAMALNNLVASPGFGAWMEGQPLDIGAMLRTPEGKPRHAIFSIAHLGDAERMFFVSLLLNQVLGWTRVQSGTTSLRAIVYMDEIAGYFPPTANPPSKQPLLTLMKQGRAFGVGVVLATQNPVDLDYKGLSNAGTWFIGRLQTDRDKQRVLDGLEGAAGNAGAGFDRAEIDRALSSLGTRVFLMNNIHEDGAVVFETRWCLSYLRGPLTRQQIKSLMDPLRAKGAGAASAGSRAAATGGPSVAKAGDSNTAARAASGSRPVLGAEVPQYFIPARAVGAQSKLVYKPMLLGMATIYYIDTKAGVDLNTTQSLLVELGGGPVAVDWDAAEPCELAEEDLEREPEPGASFASLPPEAARARSYAAWQKDCAAALFKAGKLELFRHPALKMVSRQGETESQFRTRLGEAMREQRDAQKERLRAKYAPKIAALAERRRKAEQRAEVERTQAAESKVAGAFSIGASILGALLGRKTLSAANVSRVATAARGVGRMTKESGDVGRAEENIAAVDQQLADLNAQAEAEIAELESRGCHVSDELEKVVLKPKKTNITVKALVLAWAPFAVGTGGEEQSAWS